MHRILLWRQLRLLVVAALFVMVGVAGALAFQFSNNDVDNDAHVQSTNAVHFWEMVAGEASSASPTVDVLMARDLAGLSQAEAEQFRGNSNRYGGITDTIGFDPFDESGLNCFECGPLNQEALRNLALIREGRLDEVIDKVYVPAPDAGYQVTPFGWSVPYSVFMFWLVGAPVTLLIAYQTSDLGVRRFGDLFPDNVSATSQWRRRHRPGPYDQMGLMVLNAQFFLPFFGYRILNRRRFVGQIRELFPEHLDAIQSLDRALERIPDSEMKDAVQARRDQVMLELESQTRSSDGSTENLEALMEKLGSMQEYLQARDEAKRELR